MLKHSPQISQLAQVLILTPASVSSPIDGCEKGVKICNVSTRVKSMKDFYFSLDAFHKKRLGWERLSFVYL